MNRVTRLSVRIVGITQGVGFRPYIWQLAQRFELTGWVQNDSAGLLFEIQGDSTNVDSFLQELKLDPPPLARLDAISTETIELQAEEDQFVIRKSLEREGVSNPVTQDISVCQDCLRELQDPRDRRFHYPFINCTNCGPRFTIIEDLPYDRAVTTMKSFPMCGQCQAEYEDPADRRFHAQPNACPQCGPKIWFEEQADSPSIAAKPDLTSDETLRLALDALRGGKIVAVKGIGGFHLLCDANNKSAVDNLRQRKGRIDKPFAVLANTLDEIKTFADVNQSEQELLESKERPIVLLRKTKNSTSQKLLDIVAPGIEFVGVMLPYSPLHFLLAQSFSPLVATSGNITDEPIARTNDEAKLRLANLSDAFLLHDREIKSVCDDSVVRCVANKRLPIRRSRGYAPVPIQLDSDGPTVLAVGGEIKATFCVTKNNYAYLSQHIGDVGNLETLEALRSNIEQFQKLLRLDFAAVAADMHPEYLSSRWAREFATQLGIPFIPVQHHVAHAKALAAERLQHQADPMIVCCFDGTGFGSGGAIWGGEFLTLSDQAERRAAHLQYFSLPGGDSSIKRPYRTALALLWQLGVEWSDTLPCVNHCAESERKLLRQQLSRNFNCAMTSSGGRLFDAVASLIGIRHEVTYEAQAAMELEALAAEAINEVEASSYDFGIGNSKPLEVTYDNVIKQICIDVRERIHPSKIAAKFHLAVARMVGAVCEKIRNHQGIASVGLTGGVFQNALLLEQTERVLDQRGFNVVMHSIVPPNDGGIALGQAIFARDELAKSPT